MSLEKAFDTDMSSSQSLGSQYLKVRDLRDGDILKGFYIGCQVGIIKGKEVHIVAMLLMDKTGKLERKFSAAKTLVSNLGSVGLPYMTAIQIRFDGYGGVAGTNEYAKFTPEFTDKTIFDYAEMLPPTLMRMVKSIGATMPRQDEIDSAIADADGVYLGNDAGKPVALEDKSDAA
jgi:hypothetical protein